MSKTKEELMMDIAILEDEVEILKGIIENISKDKRLAVSTSKYSDNFEWTWNKRLKRQGSDSKTAAYKQWCARLKEGYTEREMAEGLIEYGKYCTDIGNAGTSLIMQTSRFFGKEKHFESTYEAKKETTTKPQTQTKKVSFKESCFDKSWAT